MHRRFLDRRTLQPPSSVLEEHTLLDTALHALKGVPAAIACLSPQALARAPRRLASTGASSAA
eukprot:2140310-Pyramimonas_sp.AAC.1